MQIEKEVAVLKQKEAARAKAEELGEELWEVALAALLHPPSLAPPSW